jgi:hypothetical protein
MAFLAACGIFCTLSGCGGKTVVIAPVPHPVVAHPSGPPPHAPAHGYRRHHQSGCELQFDKSLGVYVVIGRTATYFHDDSFLRVHGGTWQISASLEGPWKSKDMAGIPPGLLKKHKGKKPKA